MIDTSNNTVKATVAVGTAPVGIAASKDGKKVYVANSGSNTVSVIDTSNETVTATVDVGTTPEGVAVTPNSKEVYVTNQDSNNVSVIDTSNDTVTYTIKVKSHPEGVSITPDGREAYIANEGSDDSSVIDIPTHTEVQVIHVGASPHSIGDFITTVPSFPPGAGGCGCNLDGKRVDGSSNVFLSLLFMTQLFLMLGLKKRFSAGFHNRIQTS